MSRARALAASAVAICTLALLFAIPALYLPGLAALLAAALAPAWVALVASRARVSLAAPATMVTEGERIGVRVAVKQGRLPSPGTILTPWPGAEPLALPAGRRGSVELSLLARRRGLRAIGPARLRIGDPLGLCAREVRSAELQLLVLPRVEAIDARVCEQLEGGGSARPQRTPAGDTLRPYRSGSPAARMHWPTVARTGLLMERGDTAEGEPGILVALDAQAPASEEDLDRAVRAAASICLHLARRGGCELLLPGAARPAALTRDLRAWPALLRALALVEGGVPSTVGANRDRAHELIYVTASDVAPPPLRGRLVRVAPRPLAGQPVAFTVAGCAAQPLETWAWAQSA